MFGRTLYTHHYGGLVIAIQSKTSNLEDTHTRYPKDFLVIHGKTTFTKYNGIVTMIMTRNR